MRPLHYACRQGSYKLADFLMRTGKVSNPMKPSLNQLKPIDVIDFNAQARTKLLELFQPYIESSQKFQIDSYTKVFVCGYSTAGKSSLSQILVDRSTKPLGYKFSEVDVVSDVTPFTAGIDLHSIKSPEVGNVILHDFAGHTEFYSSHAGILEHLMLHSPGVFVIVADLKIELKKRKSQLLYWLRFIDNICAKISRQSHIIVVGSRADKLPKGCPGYRIDIEEIVKESSIQQDYKGFCPMDCHRPGGIGVSTFVETLAKSCQEVTDSSEEISYYCHVIYSILKDMDEVAITQKELLNRLDNDDMSLPNDPSKVSDILSVLSDKGLILFLINQDVLTQSWIVIDKIKLVREVVGVLFAPESIERVHADIASNTGIIEVSKLNRLFENLDTHMLKGFLTALEFCHVVDSEVFQMSFERLNGELLFFPALIAEKTPAEMNHDPSWGWFVKCDNPNHLLTDRFLHVLLLRLALFHVSGSKSDSSEQIDGKSIELNQQCTVWIRGIHWISHSIEVLVKVSLEDGCITLLLSQKDNIVAQKIFSSIVAEIHDLLERFCPYKTKEYIINFSQLVDKKEQSLVSLRKIARAVILRNKLTDKDGRHEVLLENVLSSFEPYLSIPPFLMKELFNPDLSEQRVDQSHSACLHNVCHKKVLEGISFSSYKEVREHIKRFSIFTDYNPVVS